MYKKTNAANYFRPIFFLCLFLQNLTLLSDGFAAGTVVATAQGTVPIELLQPEQKVLCASPRGNILPRPITTINTVHTDQVIEVTFDDNITVAMSPRQRIYAMSRESWTEAEDLCVGDTVYTMQGIEVEVTEVVRKHMQATLYAPTIQGYHNLFVSPCGIFAHNAAVAGAILSACAVEIIEAITYTLVAIAAAREAQDFYEERRLKKELEELSDQLDEAVGSSEDFDEDEEQEESTEVEDDEAPSNEGMLKEIREKLALFNDEAEAAEEEKPAKTIDEILEDATPIGTTRTRTEQFEKDGGYEQAKEDFDDLKLTDVFEIDIGEVGYLPDGKKVIVRTESTDTRITLEVQSPSGKSLIKIRYN